MDLDEYLFRKKISLVDFAKKVDLSTQTIRAGFKGELSFSSAKRIVIGTDYQVGFEELMREVYHSMISEYIRKKK